MSRTDERLREAIDLFRDAIDRQSELLERWPSPSSSDAASVRTGRWRSPLTRGRGA